MSTEKSYRVIFRKNLGNGKRTRVIFKASDLTLLAEAITAHAKEERMRPMRVQEMNGSTVIAKFRIKLVEGEYDISKAKERIVADIEEAIIADTTKIEEAKNNTPVKPTPKAKKVTAKDVAMADMDEDGDMTFEVD